MKVRTQANLRSDGAIGPWYEITLSNAILHGKIRFCWVWKIETCLEGTKGVCSIFNALFENTSTANEPHNTGRPRPESHVRHAFSDFASRDSAA